jgi:mannose-6-phosphate isomerase-like protein (cupin superfamily)
MLMPKHHGEDRWMRAPAEVRVLRTADHGPVLPIVEGEGSARPIVWPGVGAAFRSMHRIELAGGSRTIVLKHEMEATYYVIRGDGVVRDPDEGSSASVVEGSMIFVEPGTAYAFEAKGAGMLLLGGPCPADPALYQRTG